jgi:adenylate kinase
MSKNRRSLEGLAMQTQMFVVLNLNYYYEKNMKATKKAVKSAPKKAVVKKAAARGRQAKVYTMEKVKIVKARVEKGEFINKICKDLGMDYKNFCRFCRKQGVKVMSKAQLKANYKNRDYSRSGRKAVKKAAPKKAVKKAAPKKVAKKSSKK